MSTRYCIVTRAGLVVGEGEFAASAWIDSYRWARTSVATEAEGAECVPYEDTTHEIRGGKLVPFACLDCHLTPCACVVPGCDQCGSLDCDCSLNNYPLD